MGTMLVQKYTTRIIQLMRYELEYAEKEERRKHYYMKGIPLAFLSLPQALQSVSITYSCPTLKKQTNAATLVEMGLKQKALEEAPRNKKRQRP